MRVGPSLIPGAVVCGNRGLGVLGSTILADTATGDHGAGFLYNDVDPGDEAKAFRGLIVTQPSAGTFFAFEDGSFSFDAPDGSYTFVYRLYVDGVDFGTETVSITIGEWPGTATGTIASISLTAPTASAVGATGSAIWPTPDHVLSGTMYGPNGNDYTGTALSGNFPTVEDIVIALNTANLTLTLPKFLALKDI